MHTVVNVTNQKVDVAGVQIRRGITKRRTGH